MNNNLFKIKEEIEMLNKPRQIEILKIFVDNNISTTENKNGNFINLSMVNDKILSEINNKLKYFNQQDKTLNEMEEIKQNFQETFFDKNNNKKQNKDKVEYAV